MSDDNIHAAVPLAPEPNGTPHSPADPPMQRQEEYIVTPAGLPSISKVDRFCWTVVDVPGVFRHIDKTLLHIDHDYQREKVSPARVKQIAAHWSWMACGCLIVAERTPGDYWVADGQHRKLAADKREDILKLPCLVFQVASKAEEARGFADVNSVRGAVQLQDRFRALCVAGDKAACAVKELVESSGYHFFGKGNTGPFTVACIEVIMSSYLKDPALAQRVWKLCIDVASGQHVDRRLYAGLFYLEGRLQRLNRRGNPHITVFTPENQERLVAAGWPEILKRMEVPVRYVKESGRGQAGARAWAEGIVSLLNYKRRTRKLPSMLLPDGTEEDTADAS